MNDEHTTFKIKIAFDHVHEGHIKTDITDLRCRLCSEKLETLQKATDHLGKVHNVTFHLDDDLGVTPFILRDMIWSCALCPKKFTALRSLSRHTITHFCKFTCDSCGRAYFVSSALKQHLKVCVLGDQKVCAKCHKTFKTYDERRRHWKASPQCWSYMCIDCGERFLTSTLRNLHRQEVHGTQAATHACSECKEEFPKIHKLRAHFIIAHTNEYLSCTCGKRFATKKSLDLHSVIHNKQKMFPCVDCPKTFATKKNLTQHMWIHSKNKRFECVPCNKQFNQRVSWKTHVKSYHPEMEILPYKPKSIFDQI